MAYLRQLKIPCVVCRKQAEFELVPINSSVGKKYCSLCSQLALDVLREEERVCSEQLRIDGRIALAKLLLISSDLSREDADRIIAGHDTSEVERARVETEARVCRAEAAFFGWDVSAIPDVLIHTLMQRFYEMKGARNNIAVEEWKKLVCSITETEV